MGLLVWFGWAVLVVLLSNENEVHSAPAPAPAPAPVDPCIIIATITGKKLKTTTTEAPKEKVELLNLTDKKSKYKQIEKLISDLVQLEEQTTTEKAKPKKKSRARSYFTRLLKGYFDFLKFFVNWF